MHRSVCVIKALCGLKDEIRVGIYDFINYAFTLGEAILI